MPRLKWIPENKYCRRSKLPEDLFIVLMDSYFSELIDCKSREDAVYSVSFLLSNNVRAISTQTIGKYFDLFGNYIWKNIVFPSFPDVDSDVIQQMFLYFYNRIENVDIDFYFPVHFFSDGSLKEIPFKRSFMCLLLEMRSKKVNGFKADRFYLEYSRAAFVETMLVTMKLQYYPNDLFIRYLAEPSESYEYHKLSAGVKNACRACLCRFLEENPLG